MKEHLSFSVRVNHKAVLEQPRLHPVYQKEVIISRAVFSHLLMKAYTYGEWEFRSKQRLLKRNSRILACAASSKFLWRPITPKVKLFYFHVPGKGELHAFFRLQILLRWLAEAQARHPDGPGASPLLGRGGAGPVRGHRQVHRQEGRVGRQVGPGVYPGRHIACN